MNIKMTTEQYLTLVERIGYPEPHKSVIVAQITANDPAARFTVYGTARRKGLLQTDAPAETVTCACGATYNKASRGMAYAHSSCGR